MNASCIAASWPALLATTLIVFGLPSRGAPLTFDEALQLAESDAPSLAAQASRITASRLTATPAGELPDPKLFAGIDNLPVSGPTPWSLTEDFMTMRKIGVMQEVPNARKRRARVAVAEASIARDEAELRIERLEVRLETALAWIARHTVERKLAVLNELHAENRLLAETVRAELAAGRAMPIDAVMPKQEAALLAERADELEREGAEARATLMRWIGPSGADPLAGDPPGWTLDRDVLTSRLERHPEIAAFGAMTRMAQAELREAEAMKSADWGIELAYQKRGREFGDMVSVQLTLDLPFLPARRQDPLIAASRAELTRLDAEREAMRRELAQGLAVDLLELDRLERALERTREAFLPLAEEKVELALASYRAGMGMLDAVIDARRELIEARLRQIELEGERALTAARLQLAYGEDDP